MNTHVCLTFCFDCTFPKCFFSLTGSMKKVVNKNIKILKIHVPGHEIHKVCIHMTFVGLYKFFWNLYYLIRATYTPAIKKNVS